MSYTKQQFNKCVFNPLIDDPIRIAYPKLNDIVLSEWSTDSALESILRYVILMYDPKSIIIKEETDLNYRKGVAADLARIPENIRESVYDFTHQYIIDLIVKYLIRFAKSKEFACIIAFETSYWESIRKVMEPIQGDNSKSQLESIMKKSAIKDEIDKDIIRLDKYYSSFFGDDKDLEVRAKTRITPESIAGIKL